MPTEFLTHDEELHLVRCVQAGDESAWDDLSRAYAPMLKAIATRVGGEDALATAQSHLYLAVMEHTTGRLGQYKHPIERAVRDDLSLDAAVATVPTRTFQRYWSIYRKSGYDAIEALTLCQQYQMSIPTFLRVHALANAETIDALTDGDLEPINDESTERLAAIALGALTEEQMPVVALKWMQPHGTESDTTVAYFLAIQHLGVDAANRGERDIPWTRVRYLRQTAMHQMREALGIEKESENKSK